MALKEFLCRYERQHIDHEAYERSFSDTKNREEYGTDKYLLKNVLDILLKYKYDGVVKILDVGCDTGGLGKYLQDFAPKSLKYELHGFEFPGADLRLLKKRGYVKVITGNHVSHISGNYHAVVCNQVLEHLFPEDLREWALYLRVIGRVVIVSAPFPWHSFAWNRDYLRASQCARKDIPEGLLQQLVGAVHKTVITPRMMRKLGYRKLSTSHPMSSYFYVADTNAVPYLEDSSGSRYNRQIYERVIMSTLLTEPLRYRVLRLLIRVVSVPAYHVRRLVRGGK